jgi:hypothetical protein
LKGFSEYIMPLDGVYVGFKTPVFRISGVLLSYGACDENDNDCDRGSIAVNGCCKGDDLDDPRLLYSFFPKLLASGMGIGVSMGMGGCGIGSILGGIIPNGGALTGTF